MLKIKNKIILLLIFLLTIILIGCQQSYVTTSSTESKNTSSSDERKMLTVSEVMEAFKKANLPIEKEKIFTAENDPNKLLGRPNQYIEKASWADKRIKQVSPENLQGGTVEAFSSTELLEQRKKYVEEIGKASPLFVQYQFSHKNILVRLEKELTPEQSSEYEKVIKGL